jgi:outer membrane protein assembly factor BamB
MSPRLTRSAALAAAVLAAAVAAGLGGVATGAGVSAGKAHSRRLGSGSWTRFGYDAARTSVAPHGLTAAQVRRLSGAQVKLPGTVDSSPIFLRHVRVRGKSRNLLVVTTTYGRTLGLSATTGRRMWIFTPSSYRSVAGSAQITTSTPVADPSGRFVYAASSDGVVHKIRVSNGHQVTSGAWPTKITRNPQHEKMSTAMNLAGHDVLATMGGYAGDAPPYQGKVVSLDRRSGRIDHVFNSLCSNRRRVINPSTCSSQQSAIWGRAGAVVDPKTHRVYAATGNGPFNGRTDWGDSVVELAPGAKRLLRHFTPTDQQQLNDSDADLGSTSPALLPAPKGGPGARYLLQGGKDAKLKLLSLRTSLHGVTGKAGRRLGGQVQTLPTPGGDQMFTAPAVLHRSGTTRVFVATGSGTAAYKLAHGRLKRVWGKSTAGTSPVVAGGLLWVYDPNGALNVYRPGSGKRVRSLPVPSGHWNSPIVAGKRVYVPTGDANAHQTTGELSIFRIR